MLAALALFTALAGPQTVDLTPTDDVWVYSHASDNKDVYLRVWGSGGGDVAADSTEMEEFSYSYLKFDLSRVPAGKLTGAKLILTHTPGPSYTLDVAAKCPLQVRPLPIDFDEKTWEFAMVDKVKPQSGAKAIFGKASPESLPASDKEFSVTVDLLKGPNDFAAYFSKAAGKSMSLALTTNLDVSEERRIYKFFSKDCETAAKRPVLRLTIGE